MPPGAGAPGDRGPAGTRRRRLPGWAVPGALALTAAAALVAAVLIESGDSAAQAVSSPGAVVTPVLSARRAPDVIAAPVGDRRLTADLDAWLAASPADTCLVVAGEGREVYDRNGVQPVTGASTQKLLTATGLLMALGPDARFTTTAVAAREPQGGVITGDLYVVGGGDAALATGDWALANPGRPRAVHDVDALAAAIAAAGVTQIQGSVVGDGSRYDDQRYEPSLAPRLIAQNQIGPIGGLMVNDGFGGAGPSAPSGDPALDAARVVTDRLAAHGVTVTGTPVAGVAPPGAVAVASIDSPPVSQIVAEMLTFSDNETAESAMKEVGRSVSGEGTWAAGAAGVTSLLAQAGVSVDGVRVVDGTGLSIEDQLTCQTLVDVLARPETGPVLRSGLPVAGQSGTLIDRWEDSPVAGRLRAKTGTLRNVTALAGEVQAAQGGSITFAYVANVPDPGSVTFEQVGLERLGEILLAYPEGVDLAALAPLPADTVAGPAAAG
ncbi:MAG TPA: D-alanyl-D-alanine carboxypeptidase/D-alanyl-D-alanine-endopeptidase [Acidimicrobiales bacterium]|nr:D-alanyl-D-alanine carboxypeptidase/D-alanyl-D-alanine-endopeptidase [Acidimicrobiales bacterium]